MDSILFDTALSQNRTAI